MRKPALLLVIMTTLSFSFDGFASEKPKVVEVAKITTVVPKVSKKDPVKCHKEANVRVCRPDSVAANKANSRSTASLKRSNRKLDLRSLLGPGAWLFPKRLYEKLVAPTPKK